LPHFHPYCLKIDRGLNIVLLYGILKGFCKLFLISVVIAFAKATLNQAVFGCNKGIKKEISEKH
jgi:hypothetical protein